MHFCKNRVIGIYREMAQDVSSLRPIVSMPNAFVVSREERKLKISISEQMNS